MKNMLKTLFAAVVISSTSASAFASGVSWDFTPSNNHNITRAGGADYGNTFTLTQGGIVLTIGAWSDTDSGEIESAFLANNSGGLLAYANDGNAVRSGHKDGQDAGYTSEEHAIDNVGGDIDAVLFSFSEAVSLTGLSFGWTRGGPDVSIAAFSALPTLVGNTWNTVISAANVVYKNSFDNLSSGTISNTTSGGNVIESKYWLVSAYNSLFRDLMQSSSSHDVNDQFKVSGLTVHRSVTPPTSASAPSIIGLLLVALVALGYRRHLQK